MATQNRKNAGRPAGTDSEKVKADLLEAARKNFQVREFKAVSVREIADAAGVNAAMVNYYFGSKEGLYIAMLDELLAKLEARLAELGKGKDLTVTDFSRIYTRVLVENPWWPNFLVREVLFKEGDSHNAVIERFASVFAPRLMASINSEIQSGQFRADLDPGLTMLSMIGLTVFPFLASPILKGVMGRELDANTVEALIEHNIALFHDGVLRENRSEGIHDE